MKRPVKRLLFWAPRILCILFAAFVSLFALDVFDQRDALVGGCSVPDQLAVQGRA
jgi:hypothetical protein